MDPGAIIAETVILKPPVPRPTRCGPSFSGRLGANAPLEQGSARLAIVGQAFACAARPPEPWRTRELKLRRTALLLLILISTTTAAHAAEVRLTDRILPFIQDGGGASTSITIVNLETTPSTFELLFMTNTGQYWQLPVEAPAGIVSDGSYVRGTLAPGRGVTIQTAGTAVGQGTGHATIYSPDNARLGLDIRVNPKGWTFTAAPQREDVLMLPFDNTGGASTSFLWVSDTPSSLVTYVVTNDEGRQLVKGRYQFSVQDNNVQTLFALIDLIPETAGQRGLVSLLLDYPNAGIYDELYFTGLAIQTDANGLTAVKPSMSSGTWKAARH